MVRSSRQTVAALALLFIAAGTPPVFAEDKPAEAAATQAFPAIVVTSVATRTLVDKVVATGTIRAVNDVYVQPQVDGLSIRALNADVGDRVEADSVLAVLNDDALLLQKSQMEATKAKAEASVAQMQAQIAEARANADDAIRQRDRAVRLGKTGTMSTSQVEHLTAAATVAEARTRSAEQSIAVAEADIKVVDAQIADIDLRLARTSVKAPVAGVISARDAKIGAIAMMGGGQPLFTLIQDGALELIADVSEGEILKIKVGKKATIALAGSRETLNGSVRLVSPAIDAVSRLGSVHIALDDSEKARAGMYGSATIIVETADGIALPLTALLTGGDGETTARKVENDVVKLVKVRSGIQDGAFIQIVEGLKEGDEVVAKAGAYVRDGDRINPVRTPQTQTN